MFLLNKPIEFLLAFEHLLQGIQHKRIFFLVVGGCVGWVLFLVVHPSPLDGCGAHGHGYLFCLSTVYCQIING